MTREVFSLFSAELQAAVASYPNLKISSYFAIGKKYVKRRNRMKKKQKRKGKKEIKKKSTKKGKKKHEKNFVDFY